jgi:hypothetical protein
MLCKTLSFIFEFLGWGESEQQAEHTLSNTLLVLSQILFASSIKLSLVAVNSGGACGGVRYCFGAILEFVIGLNAPVFAGRRCWKREESRGPMREDVEARMKRIPAKRMRPRRTDRTRGFARFEIWAGKARPVPMMRGE